MSLDKLDERSIAEIRNNWRLALDAVPDIVFFHDRNFLIVRANKAYADRCGLPFDQIIGRPYYEIFPLSAQPLESCVKEVDFNKIFEEETQSKSGEWYRTRMLSVHDGAGDYLYSVHIMQNITRSKQLESQEKMMSYALEQASESVILLDTDLYIRYANSSMGELVKQDREKLINSPLKEFIPKKDHHRISEITKSINTDGSYHGEVVLQDSDGRMIAGFLNASSVHNEKGEINGYVSSFLDLRALKSSEEHYRLLMDSSRDGIAIINKKYEVVEVNTRFAQMLGYETSELIGMRTWDFDALMSEEDIRSRFSDPASTNVVIETRHRRKDGSVFDVEVSIGGTVINGEPMVFTVNRDISRRKKIELELKRSESRLKQIVEKIADGIMVLDEMGSIQFANPAAAALFGRTPKSLKGIGFGLPESKDRGIEVEVPHSDGTYKVAEMRLMGTEFEGIKGFVVNLHDISERRTLEEERMASIRQEHKTMLATVKAIAATIEQRDPYTAGHQQRVAHLAEAIAEEMGLKKERIEGIQLSGLMHDIGKISIPSDILNRPGRLNEYEFGLIRAHPETGYNILKEIPFKCPIAQAVYQHHERLDGSGYPRGLRGDDILLEARIMCVADVVEAMASHRPYRPGLGVEAALREIQEGRGKTYDADVVDACLHLFEQGYHLIEAEKGFI